MNALVGVRANASGFLSPTSGQRAAVQQQLAETAAARAGGQVAEGIGAAASANATQEGAATTGLEKELGKDTFLKLLVLELQNQDPLNPLDNTDMIAQLAQFSALEAQTTLNDNFEILSGNVDQLNFISAAQLLDKTVSGLDVEGELRTGVVESVHLDGSLVVLSVDGHLMTMAGIISIEPETAPGAGAGQ